eukprot:7272007-Alexandrium_andersonii.AAC.1
MLRASLRRGNGHASARPISSSSKSTQFCRAKRGRAKSSSEPGVERRGSARLMVGLIAPRGG